VAYDPISGDTHLLSAFAAQLLLLAGNGKGSEELVSAIAHAAGQEPSDDLRADVEGMIEELQSKGLWNRTCCSPS